MTEIEGDWEAAFAALAWQVDLGATETIGETPVDRYSLPEPVAKTAAATAAPAAPKPAAAYVAPPTPAALTEQAVQTARHLAQSADTLDALRAALQAFDHCDLKRGARSTVFGQGTPGARVLVLGEAPNRDEDQEGRPFAGRSGQLLDKMFAAIGLSRENSDPAQGLYLSLALPWRPPADRDPTEDEIAMLRPFVERHIALANPAFVVAMGNLALKSLTGSGGILRARGNWTTAVDRPALPMTHPDYLLRYPAAKREAWADLLSLQARLRARP